MFYCNSFLILTALPLGGNMLLMETKKLSLKSKLAFACTDIFGGGSFNLINFLYPTYAALVLGLRPGLVGIVFLVAKIWDAVNDPIMGIISDRTSSRMGKRRIYILIGAPLVVLSMALLFFPWSMSSVGLRFALALVCYMLFDAVQTLIMVPYFSLASEVSGDYSERSSANAIRLSFSIFSSLLCVMLPGMIVDSLQKAGMGVGNSYIIMSVTFGLLFALPMLFTVFAFKEEIVSPPIREKVSFKNFVQPLKSKSFRRYFGMAVCNGLTMAIMSGLFFFFVNFVLKSGYTEANAGSQPFVTLLSAGLMFATQIVALPFYINLVKRKDKRYAYIVGAAIWIAVGLSLFLVPRNLPDSWNWVIMILAVLMGFGISGALLVPHSLLGDVNDACEVQFGQRKEGVVSGLTNFVNKASQAVGMQIIFGILDLAKFVSREDPTGPAVVSQPASAQTALTLLIALAPLVIMSVGIFVCAGYRINKSKQAEIAEFLEKQRAAENFSDLDAERAALLNTL